MPIDKRRYVPNWNQLSLSVKEQANWKCKKCGRPCRRKGETLPDFINRMEGEDWPELDWANHLAPSQIYEKPQRFTLTVAHLDQNPANNAPDNLAALCSVCHLQHDRPFRQANARAKREWQGQMALSLEKEGNG